MQLKSLEDTGNLSNQISKIVCGGDIIFLYGEIGVGKTTFVRFLVNNLEVEQGISKSDVLSPTFNIVHEIQETVFVKDWPLGEFDVGHYRVRTESIR